MLAIKLCIREVANQASRLTPLKGGTLGTSSRLGLEGVEMSTANETERLLESLYIKQRKHRLLNLERFKGRRADFKA